MRWLALAFVLLGCDGLGAPVVDTAGARPPGGPYMCMPSNDDCDISFVPQAVAPPTVVTPSCKVPTETCVDATQGNCVLPLRVVAGTPVQLLVQDCVALDLETAPGSTRGELRSLTLRSSRVTIRAEQPSTFVFSGATWSNVSVELQGPVSVQISGQLQNVSFVGEGDVSIADAKATTLSVALPNGSLRVQRSDLTDAKLAVHEIVMETVDVFSVWAKAERLIGLELSGERLNLDVSDLTLGELMLSDVELDRCDTALVVNSSISNSRLGACSEVMRMHNAAILSSKLQGFVDSNATLFTGTLFGPGGAATSVQMVYGTLSGNRLCTGLRRLEITNGTSASCNDCTELDQPEQHICMRPLGGGMLPPRATLPTRNTYCPILDTGLPACGS